MLEGLVAARSEVLRTLPSGPAFAEFQSDRLAFLRRCRETADAVACRLGPDDVIVLSRPELVNDVLVAHRADFSKSYLTDLMHPLVAGSLLLADSDSWLRERRLVLPAFHHDRLLGYGEVMAEEAARTAAEWHRGGSRRDVHADMLRMTLRVVTRTLFGVDFAEGVGVAERLVSTLMDEFNRRISARRPALPLPSLSTFRVLRSLRELDRIAYRAIEERKLRPTDDLLSMLVAARDEHGAPMSDREIRDACIAVFFAGHETTACLLSWTLYVLAGRTDVQERALAELAAQGGPPATLPGRTPYTQAVLSEVLRLYPPAYAFGRRALRDTRVGPNRVPAGTTVLMSPWAMQRDARWFDDPDEFRPERWLDGLASRLPRFAYYPFSSGPRRCVGSSFALLEATIALSVLLPRFRAGSPSPHQKAAPSITLRPAGGMSLLIGSR